MTYKWEISKDRYLGNKGLLAAKKEFKNECSLQRLLWGSQAFNSF